MNSTALSNSESGTSPFPWAKAEETTNAINTPAVSLSHALLIARNVVFRIIHIETVGQLVITGLMGIAFMIFSGIKL